MQPIWDPVVEDEDAPSFSCKMHVDGNQVCSAPFRIGSLTAVRQEVLLSPISPFIQFTLWVLCQNSALVGNMFFLTDDQLFAGITIFALVYSTTVHGKKGLSSEELQVREVVGVSLLGDIQKPSGRGPEQLALGGLA